MSNEVFDKTPDSPFEEQLDYLTVVSESESGREQRYQKWLKPRRTFRLKLDARQASETKDIWDFYQRRKGSFDTFLFKNPNENPVTSETVGSGDGVKSVFYLGGTVGIGTGDVNVEPSSLTLTRAVGGTGEYLAFTAYTIDEPIGQITTNAVLPSGDVLRATSYKFRYRVRFKNDSLTREIFAAELWRYGIEFVESI